jgi:hypothetical protein
VAEVGAYAGDLTGLLLDWAAGAGARILAVDPSPQPELEALDATRADLVLVRETSLDALRHLELPDAVVIDGDHNWWTVSEELRLIAERAGSGPLPLLLFHDVSWPHARRDDYFDPEQIPDEHRQPTVHGGGIFPGRPGTDPEGLRYRWPAAQEGGPRNGVLTAVEDFVASRGDLRLAVVPAFFGLGVVWSAAAPYAAAVEAVVEDWDRNPLVERLEANRVHHLATTQVQRTQIAEEQARAAVKDELLERLLVSRSFALAERISRLRQRGVPAFSKADIRRALGR